MTLFAKLSLRFKITLLVTTVAAVGAWVFGQVAYAGLGNLLTNSTGIGAQTAALITAQTIRPEWLEALHIDTDLSTGEYLGLSRQLQSLVELENVTAIGVLRVHPKDRQVEFVLNEPASDPDLAVELGTRMPMETSPVFQQTESGYMPVAIDKPGFYMGGWAPIHNRGHLVGLVMVFTDLTDVKRALNTISLAIAIVVLVVVVLSGMVAYKFATTFEKAAVTDGLMGIYNHKYFKQRLEEESAKSARYGQQTSLVLFDIDFFKRVNDTYGHATGDLVLKLMAKWVTELCRNTDVVCRYGGEEIACILPHTGLAGAQEFAERLRLKISQQVVRDPEEDAEFRVTVSVGVVQWEKGMTMMDMIKRADAALYHSKRTGRNRVTIYQEELLPAPDMASKPERTKDRA